VPLGSYTGVLARFLQRFLHLYVIDFIQTAHVHACDFKGKRARDIARGRVELLRFGEARNSQRMHARS